MQTSSKSRPPGRSGHRLDRGIRTVVAVALVSSMIVAPRSDPAQATVTEIIEIPVGASSDDAEEADSGAVSLTSSDLELVNDGPDGDQTVGVRFDAVQLRPGASIESSYIQFQVDSPSSEATSLTIAAVDADHTPTFGAADFDISTRPRTSSQVTWAPPGWSDVGVAGVDQRTPDLAHLVQAVVDRSGWVSGNALAFIITGTGLREAESFDGGAPPILHLGVSYPSSVFAADDAYSIGAGTTLTVAAPGVLLNDSAPEGDLLHVASATPAGSGIPTVDADGSFTYAPDPGFTGSDTFSYQACNDTGICDTAIATVVVSPYMASTWQFRGHDDFTSDANSPSFGTPIEVSPALQVGRGFRLRVAVAELTGVAAQNESFRLQYRVDDGPWNTVHVNAPGASSERGTFDTPTSPVEMRWYRGTTADGTATTQLISGGAFTPGEMKDSDPVATASPSDSVTELEWSLWMHRYWDTPGGSPDIAQLRDDDVVAFRVQWDDGGAWTEVPPATTPPSASVDVPDGHIGGMVVESGTNRFAPVADASGNLYIFHEISETQPLWVVSKSSDLGRTWTVQDFANGPSKGDFEAADFLVNGDEIWVFHHGGSDPRMYRFAMASHPQTPDSWVDGGLGEQIDPAIVDTFAQSIAAGLRSDGSVVVVYTGDTRDPARDHRSYFAWRDPAGVWQPPQLLWDAASTEEWGKGVTGVMVGDAFHAVSVDHGNNSLVGKRIAPTNDVQAWDGSRVSATDPGTLIDSNVSTSGQNWIGPVATGPASLAVGLVDDASLDAEIRHVTGLGIADLTIGPRGTPVNAGGDIATDIAGSRRAQAAMVMSSSSQLVVVYAQEATPDAATNALYLRSSPDSGQTWDPPVDLSASRGWGGRIEMIGATTLTRDSGEYLAAYYHDATLAQQDAYTTTFSDGGGYVTDFGWYLEVPLEPQSLSLAAADDVYVTGEDQVLVVAAPGVLENDTDPEGDPLTANLLTGPSDGQLTLSIDGSFTYTPDPSFSGSNSFTYEASDGELTDTATVTITVEAINGPPVANDDLAETSEDVPVTTDVVANDTDPDGNLDASSITVTTAPAHGSAIAGLGSVTYTPDADAFGSDSYSYQVCDTKGSCDVATVSVTVHPVDDAPVATDDSYTTPRETALVVPAPGVLENDSDVDGDPITAGVATAPANGSLILNTDGSFTYTPDAGFSGSDSFTYAVSDGALTDTATVTIDAPGTQTFEVVADSESTLLGSVTAGSHLETHVSDDVYEQVTEQRSNGNPSQRVSSLEHDWQFSVPSSDVLTFHLEAHHSPNSETDDFVFSYSTDGVNFTDMLTLTKNADDDQTQSFGLPSGVAGDITVRVIDTDRTRGNGETDSLFVDRMFFVVETSGSTPGDTITIHATDPSATEDGDPAAFTVTRVGDTTAALSVSYEVSGTAVGGADYGTLSGQVEIAAGQDSATIDVAPIQDGVAEPLETVAVTLVPGSGYDVGSPGTATVTITDDDGATGVALSEQTNSGLVVTGSYIDTWLADGVSEAIREDRYGGGRTRLDHVWTFDLVGASSWTFEIEAYHDSQVEDFVFEYSGDGGTWNPLVTITANREPTGPLSVTIPVDLSGPVSVRVVDTSRDRSDSGAETIYVDFLRFVGS